MSAMRSRSNVEPNTGGEGAPLILMKNNIGVKRHGLAFRVITKFIFDETEGNIETSSIEWDADEVTTTEDEAQAAAGGKPGG
jgi:hypothetical protein